MKFAAASESYRIQSRVLFHPAQNVALSVAYLTTFPGASWETITANPIR